MKKDPLVEEGRAAARAYFASLNNDWDAIREDLNRRAKEEGLKVVSREARKAPRRRKKAG
jgi:hypothetical protein